MKNARLVKIELQLWDHQAELGSRAIRKLIELGIKAKADAEAKESVEEPPRRRRTKNELS